MRQLVISELVVAENRLVVGATGCPLEPQDFFCVWKADGHHEVEYCEHLKHAVGNHVTCRHPDFQED